MYNPNPPPLPMKKFFNTHIFWPRTVNSVFRAIWFQFLALWVLVTLINLNIWSPWTYIFGEIGILLTPSSWIYDILTAASIGGLGFLYTRQITLHVDIPKNQISNLARFFHPEIMLSFVAHLCAGGFLMRSYLGLCGGKFNSLTYERSLNVGHVFLVLSASFMSLKIWKEFHFGNLNLIQFPLLAQTGNAQLSRQMSKLLVKSVVGTALNLRWFYVLYLFIGHRLVNLLSEISRMPPTYTTYLVTPSIGSHFDLLLQALFFNSLLTFVLGLLRIIICIDLTKRYEFDIIGEHQLTKAMSEPNQELLNHLAFYEFNLISQESKEKRVDFLKLSQPGGHPHNWNNLSNICLAKIDDFVKKLNDSSANQQQNSATETPQENKPILYSASNNKTRPLAVKENNNQPTLEKKEKIGDLLQKIALSSYPVKILKALRDKFSNNSLFNSAPDSATRGVFAQSQIVIWAVEGLSFLISNSIQEDRYGVVQKDLPKLISSFFVLQKTVDKHKGVTISSKKNRLETRDLQLKQELRVALKSSIYRIISTYGNHLNSISLPAEHKKKIASYKMFQEG